MISICIPTYEQKGVGHVYFKELLESIRKQNILYPYNIIISDNSLIPHDVAIREVINSYSQLPIVYHRNLVIGGACENINNVLSLATYPFVKLMCMDDLFYGRDSINYFVQALRKYKWVISSSYSMKNNRAPHLRSRPVFRPGNYDKNTIGMPSVIGFHKNDIKFNSELKTFCDLYYYNQLYKLFGNPGYIYKPCVIQRYHKDSLSNNQEPSHKKDAELIKMYERSNSIQTG